MRRERDKREERGTEKGRWEDGEVRSPPASEVRVLVRGGNMMEDSGRNLQSKAQWCYGMFSFLFPWYILSCIIPPLSFSLLSPVCLCYSSLYASCLLISCSFVILVFPRDYPLSSLSLLSITSTSHLSSIL